MAEKPSARQGSDTRSVNNLLNHTHWLASPLLLAVVGLVGASVGVVVQGFWNSRLERQKFEFALINNAMAPKDRDEVIGNLEFLRDVGLLTIINQKAIDKFKQPDSTLPRFSRQSAVPIHLVKSALAYLRFYDGPIDNQNDDAFRKAVSEFQKLQNIPADGILGPSTLRALERAAPDYIANPMAPWQLY